MAKDEEGSPEKGFVANDYFSLGIRIARRFCGCNDAEYERLLLDLAAGVVTLVESTADFRVLRDSLPEGQLKRRAEIALKRSDLEEAFRYARTTDRRLARAVLKSCWNEEVLAQRIQERQAEAEADRLSSED